MKKTLQKFSKKFNHLLVSYFLAFLTITNIVSCESCENIQVDNNTIQYPKLILNTDKKQYIGLSDVEVTLHISHAEKNTNAPVTYGNYKLKVTVTQEGGTENSSIQYTAFDETGASITTETASINEKLTHFFKVTDTELIAATEEPQITFNIIPKGNPTKVTVHYELLDASNKNKLLYKHTITWEPIQTPTPTYELNVEGRSTTIQAPAPIKLEIREKEGGPIEIADLSQLKIEITKQSGDATVDGMDNDGKLGVTLIPADIDKQNSLIKKVLPVTVGNQAETIFKLQLKYGNIDMGEALVLTYKNQPADIWQFELLGADTATHTLDIKGITDIEIKITKVSNPILTQGELEGLKLHIERTTGDTAIFANIKDGILEFKDFNRFTLATDGKSATKKLTIQPNTDKSASFSLGIQDKKGALIGTMHHVIWKNGAQLKLKSDYDISTGKVTVTITNNGTINLAANQATLSWDTGDNNVIIDNNREGSQHLNEIIANGNSIPLELGYVTFKNGKRAATLNLQLKWDQLEEIIQANQPLTAIPIDITLTHISFDRLTNHINYNLKNNSNQDINLQVECINNQVGNQATINTKLESFTLRKAGEAGSETGNQKLPITFNGENNADFKFRLLYNGTPISFKHELTPTEVEKEISEYVIPCRPRQVKLKFEVTNAPTANSIQLQGDNKEIRFKIVPNGNTNEIVALEQIDKNKLKLVVEKVNTTLAEIYQGTTLVREELSGNQLNLGNANNLLTIRPDNDNQANFVLKLMYASEELARLSVKWEEDKFEMIVHHPTQGEELLGGEEGYFTIKNTTHGTKPSDITIELQSSNDVQFGCLAPTKAIPSQPASTTTSFQQNLHDLLVNNTTIDSNTKIPFRMINPNGYKDSTITIIARKHGKEIARTIKDIKWKTNVSIRISSIQVGNILIEDNILLDNGSNADNTKAFKIILQNDGDDISTDNVNIQLKNMYDLQFKLGYVIDMSILSNLTKILNLNAPEYFKSGTTKEISFAVADNSERRLAIDFTLILNNLINPNVLKEDLMWINNAELKNFVDKAKIFEKEFEKAAVSFSEHLENVKGVDIENDIKELYNTLCYHILFGLGDDEMPKNNIEKAEKMIKDFNVNQLWKDIKEIIDEFERVRRHIKRAANKKVQEIDVDYRHIKKIYIKRKTKFETQSTLFMRKLSETAEKYILNADIDNKSTAKEAEDAFIKVYTPFNSMLLSLNGLVKYSQESKMLSFPMQIARIYEIFAEKGKVIIEKYIREGNTEQASKWEVEIASWK